MVAPLIVGLSGYALSDAERRFLEEISPLGVILFARNVESGPQLLRLVESARAASGAHLVLVDQEGGRVQRIRPPLAMRYPAAARIGEIFTRDREAGLRAAFLVGRLIAADLVRFRIDTPCLPVADVPVDGAHDVIGDRAFARTADGVAVLAEAAAQGVLAGGCLPVVKHIPGHGRATVDSHFSLPRVDASLEALATDFAPFKHLNGLPLAMTAHVLYGALDEKRPATLSASAIEFIRNEIGFSGLLMTDDISMGALGGAVADRAKDALQAGCDCVLHCNGRMGEMEAIARVLPQMSEAAADRLSAAMAVRHPPAADDEAQLRREFADLLAVAP